MTHQMDIDMGTSSALIDIEYTVIDYFIKQSGSDHHSRSNFNSAREINVSQFLDFIDPHIKQSRTSPQLVNTIILKHTARNAFILSLSNLLQQLFLDWKSEAGANFSRSLEILSVMVSLEWPRIYMSVYMDALRINIRCIVSENCEGVFDELCIPKIKKLIEKSLIPFCGPYFGTKSLQQNTLESKLWQYMYEHLCDTRSTELFDIVADFPDSILSLKELRNAIACCQHTNMMGNIAKVFRTTINKRLLHSGASTSQILDFYIAMIKALRILDPSDLILNFVAIPVRKYLMSRKDTVRCIVTQLTEGKDSGLHIELKKGGSLEYGEDEDDEDDGPGDNWEPQKRNPDLSNSLSGTKGLDILALLVSIYGSTDIFVNEYRTLLADKLLNNLQYYTDQELATLELLKIRFGEESLHSCEVMLHDLEESKRINNAIVSDLLKSNKGVTSKQVDYVIYSDNYWPALQSDTMIHHPTVILMLETYESSYANLKKPRKLHRVSQLGTVDLDLDFDDGTSRSFTVNPVQATLILHVAEEGKISLDQLSFVTELESADVRKRMMYWIGRHVVREIVDVEVFFEIIEDQESFVSEQVDQDRDFGDTEDAAVTVSNDVQERAIMQQLEGFIRGMLQSHGSLSIERIHTMLKLLTTGSADLKFDMNLVQFRKYLHVMIDEEKIELSDGMYRLRK